MDILTKKDLCEFKGTEKYYKHTALWKHVLLTEGCHFVAQKGKAFWLFDLILSYQGTTFLYDVDFQKWTLEKKSDYWLVTCKNSNDTVLVTQIIGYSDFPLDEITILLIDNVCLLPSED